MHDVRDAKNLVWSIRLVVLVVCISFLKDSVDLSFLGNRRICREFEFITVNLPDDQIISEPMNEESYIYRLRHVSVG